LNHSADVVWILVRLGILTGVGNVCGRSEHFALRTTGAFATYSAPWGAVA
jgi:hypothetical protein